MEAGSVFPAIRDLTFRRAAGISDDRAGHSGSDSSIPGLIRFGSAPIVVVLAW